MEETTQEAEDGVRPEVSSHYAPTATKREHKPEDCFMLPANATKKPANFIEGWFVNMKMNK